MAAPRIDSLHSVLSHSSALVQGLDLGQVFSDPESSAFVVLTAGDFGGRWFERGEVLVCGGPARPGQTVVLVAHGRGRPRLGHQRGVGFTGDRGEPCSMERWMAAGRVLQVWTRTDELDWRLQPELRLDQPLAQAHVLAMLRPLPAAPRASWPGEGTGSCEGQSGSEERVRSGEPCEPRHQLSLFGGAQPARAA